MRQCYTAVTCSNVVIFQGLLVGYYIVLHASQYGCLLRVMQSKCLRIATSAPWYNGSKHIQDDLGVLSFTNHIRSLIERFDSKVADVGNSLDSQLGRYLR